MVWRGEGVGDLGEAELCLSGGISCRGRYLSSSQDGSGPGLGLRAGDFEASALCSL